MSAGDEQTPEQLLTRATLDADLQAGARRAARGVPSGGLAAGRRRIYLRGDRRDARRADRHGDVADFARDGGCCTNGSPARVARRRAMSADATVMQTEDELNDHG